MHPSWRLAAASSIGTSHVTSGAPCQDAHEFALLSSSEGEVLVVVVCDGAGSAAHSEVGAALAARTLVECVNRHLARGGVVRDLNRQVALGFLDEIVHVIEETARSYRHASRDYACTLLAVIVGQEDVAFLQVGDGAIVVSHGEEDGWSYVFWPQHGEYANTTNFVISPKAPEVLEFEVAARRVDEFAVFSDGIEKLVLHDATRTVHEPFFNRMLKPVRSLTSAGLNKALSQSLVDYLSSPTICERTDDDKTLVLATRSVAF